MPAQEEDAIRAMGETPKPSDPCERPEADLPTSPDLQPLPPDTGRLLAVGHVLAGRFRILEFVGHGGMGDVYEAEDLELGERVALKTIRSDLAGNLRALDRFRREIRLARRVTHPNVCRTFDLFQHPD